MITDYRGLALDVSKLKSIQKSGMDLIFEFKTELQYVQNPFTNDIELHSLNIKPVVLCYQEIANLNEAFSYWLETWQDYSSQ
ncbi:hypothetical protein J5U18_12150 [Sphingobacteriaceae bacterium WQ 2009]|uniref:Uncharacterized protein n=1 Tax=Rhinopithecimicrobium faecis TaxID=2820698 RepID=A0A8T4HBY1_9SPHI|nr:hypothetical protein [Sphingobacteriaceae bacterium WQ 2009]